ncbi:hypothetical protein [Paeniglutamicibacter cryotolerans]|uniref:Uncharacterized protein n=1 Tax=Paeniglutamicibacter cryotolerans TaxID=670079 RepID=A0A839QJE4_9MICC|nr:hypothetical protein [Paeniglutamicibacter cryotolerans]MBB2994156.1 hypothetical protein [Paeniglutamicibacter cryotolerans]
MAIMDTAASAIAPPSVLTQNESLAADSIRSLGEFDGLQYFVAKSAESSGYCLAQYETAEQTSSIGCGAGAIGSIVELYVAPNPVVALTQDGHTMAPDEQGEWVKLTGNLWKHAG